MRNTLKSAYIGRILKHGSNHSRVFEGNLDSQKYASILENNINKIKVMFPKLILQWDNKSKHKSNVSLNFILKIT